MMKAQYHPTVVKFFKVLTKYTDVTVQEFVEVSTKYNHGDINSAHDVMLKIMSSGRGSVDSCVYWAASGRAGHRRETSWNSVDTEVRDNWDKIEEGVYNAD